MNVATLEPPYCYYAFAIDPNGSVEHLHYGLWGPQAQDIKTAQNNLAQLMLSLIPSGVQRVLDSGCGLGRTAYELAVAGYTVIGISPDAQNMEVARATYRCANLNLVTVPFESYYDPSPFDLLLFQESSQYVPLSALLNRAIDLLAENGYLLICDEVRYADNQELAFHPRDRLVDEARKRGLHLLHNSNLTKQVLPTRAFLVQSLKRRRSALIEAFGPTRPNVDAELDDIIVGWENGTRLFEAGTYGYETFLFAKARARRKTRNR